MLAQLAAAAANTCIAAVSADEAKQPGTTLTPLFFSPEALAGEDVR